MSSIPALSAPERGFVLATTLLVTTLLTVMLAASFILVAAEERTTSNSHATSEALALAQAGLETYFASTAGIVATQTYDSLRVPLTDGYADVVAQQVRGSGGIAGQRPLWVVESRGVVTVLHTVGTVRARRTVAQFAWLNNGTLPARAAMVALNGTQKLVGGGGTAINPFSGLNFAALVPGCINPAHGDTFAISVPAGSYYYSKSANVPDPAGVPDPDGRGVEQSVFPSWTNLYDSTHVDWGALVAGDFMADYTLPAGAPASSPLWPPPLGSRYQVGYVPGDVTIPASLGMRGMLVVQGNVRMSLGAHWDGILVVGGMFNDSAGGIVHGMVITGLNQALGMVVPQNNVPQGTAAGYHARVQWSWCYAQGAVGALSTLSPVRNAWTATWSTY